MNRAQGEERMQRIRIGLTGLAFVFLLVLLGTAISRSSEQDAVQSTPNELAADKEPSEPLAEIGAAPGATNNESGEGRPPEGQ